MELSQKQLEEMVVGKPGSPTVSFFDKPVLDRAKSEEAGRRVYRDQLMVKKTQPGVADWVAEYAQPADILRYAEEYDRYKNTRKGTTSPSIDVLPNIEPTHKQELIDYGLGTIDLLVSADVLPDHLKQAQDAAKIIYSALKEANHGGQEEGIEEEISEAEDVLALGGREERDHERRPQPEAIRTQSGGRSAQGVHQGGQEHGDQGLSPNWTVTWVTHGFNS